MDRGIKGLELRVPPVAVVLAEAALMWTAAWAIPSLHFPIRGSAVLAIMLAAIGLTVALSGVLQFRRAKTTVNPMTPDASSALVVQGVYKATRNPMYLGFALVLFAWALYLSNLAALLVFPAFVLYMNRFQILPEERALASRFGKAFSDYRQSVRRWI
jgi:protein-S-isoprenylcysteine O-methyltransferase Ste14